DVQYRTGRIGIDADAGTAGVVQEPLGEFPARRDAVRKGSAEARDAGVVDGLRRAEVADHVIFADIDVANLPGVELITEYAHGDGGGVGSLLIDGEQRDGRED